MCHLGRHPPQCRPRPRRCCRCRRRTPARSPRSCGSSSPRCWTRARSIGRCGSSTRRGAGLQFRFDPDDVAETFASASGSFLVHFAREGRSAVPGEDADATGVPDSVEEVAAIYDEVIVHYRDVLGFRPPRSDEDLPDNGGDGRFDVYLGDFAGVGDGVFRVDACDPDDEGRCAGFMTQENDYAGYDYPSTRTANRILGSHELFHAVQAAYDHGQDTPMMEGTAVWATESFDPSLQDFEGFVGGYLSNTDRSLDVPMVGPVDPSRKPTPCIGTADEVAACRAAAEGGEGGGGGGGDAGGGGGAGGEAPPEREEGDGDGGCGCRIGRPAAAGGHALGAALLGLALHRRRRLVGGVVVSIEHVQARIHLRGEVGVIEVAAGVDDDDGGGRVSLRAPPGLFHPEVREVPLSWQARVVRRERRAARLEADVEVRDRLVPEGRPRRALEALGESRPSPPPVSLTSRSPIEGISGLDTRTPARASSPSAPGSTFTIAVAPTLAWTVRPPGATGGQSVLGRGREIYKPPRRQGRREK
ncbi:MXAN_6640 family putative metalloprotease [Sorangium sp. So ce1128]